MRTRDPTRANLSSAVSSSFQLGTQFQLGSELWTKFGTKIPLFYLSPRGQAVAALCRKIHLKINHSLEDSREIHQFPRGDSRQELSIFKPFVFIFKNIVGHAASFRVGIKFVEIVLLRTRLYVFA